MTARASARWWSYRHARIALAGDPETAKEAWLILHGHGMLAQGILHWFRSAQRPHRLLVAPEALSRFYTEVLGSRPSARRG